MPNNRISNTLRASPRNANANVLAQAMRPMSQGERVNAMSNGGLSGLLTNYLSDSLSGIKRVPGLIENLLNQSPEKIAKGVLGPAYTSTTQAPLAANFIGPQADMKGMVVDASKVIPNLREGKYFDAAGNLALAAAAIPMMAVPGTIAGYRNVAKSVATPKPKIDYDAPAGGDPRYLGAAPDRSGYTYLRHDPSKGVSERTANAIQALKNNKGGFRDRLLADVKLGQKIGGDDWYNTEELRDWFIAELGSKRGHNEWVQFMELVGATSPASKVLQNIGNASAVRRRVANDPEYAKAILEKVNLDEGRRLAKGREKNYGHYAAGGQEMAISRQQRGDWEPLPQGDGTKKIKASDSTAVINPKPKGFKASLLGNETNIAADLHFTRYLGMASGDPSWIVNSSDLSQKFEKQLRKKYGNKINKYISETTDTTGKPVRRFDAKRAMDDNVTKMKDYKNEPAVYAEMPKDNEYKAFEDYINELASEVGMTGPQFQANLWMGGASRTGVDDSSMGTFMELLRKRADQKAKEIGSSRAEVIKEFIKNKGLLAIPTGVAATSLMGSNNDEIY